MNPDLARRPILQRSNSVRGKKTLTRNSSSSRKGSQRSTKRSGPADRFADMEASATPVDNQSDQSSAYSLSLENVPPRSSSRNRLDAREHSAHRLRQTDSSRPTMTSTGPLPRQPQWHMAYTVPQNREPSATPIRQASMKPGDLSLNRCPYAFTRTFIRTLDPNTDAVDFPTHRHPRFSAELQVGATTFAGGGSIEGHVRVAVGDVERSRHKRQMAISRISIDLLGVEELSAGKRTVFLNLATELIDSHNPPPRIMVESPNQISPMDPFWNLTPSTTSMPFMISLPLDVGPPPFHSKHARIRYILAATTLIREDSKQYLVRSSQDISVISVYDRKSSSRLPPANALL
jgi:hypothetical protein